MEQLKKCRECGVELPKLWSTNICLECSRAKVKKTFEEFPEVKEAFMESIRKMKEELD